MYGLVLLFVYLLEMVVLNIDLKDLFDISCVGGITGYTPVS